MAPQSSTLAWQIPETGEPGGLPSMGSYRVGRQKQLSSSSSSSSTSKFHFCNIDHSPETVPPPTMFLQVSAPNLISGSSTFEEFFGLLLINSLTDGPPVKRRYSSLMFTAARDSRVGEREQAEPPQACD